MTARKLYQRLLQHTQNVRFADFCKVVEAFGYRWDRTSGSHHIYEHPQTTRTLNLQDCRGRPSRTKSGSSCARWKNSI